ncbi:hypothetical protein [Azotobacter chroococcum]|uniref:hypothetical protein n=1 Tax=Azotobacter chroococcum TaxID=353 RepID=UPI0012FD2BA2|nr:hypothetical protein [Azotobacter chroococcum]
MLWIDPDIYSLKELLQVYPKAKIYDSEQERFVTPEEIEEVAHKENGRGAYIDDLRWDRIYLIDEDNKIIPLSAAELKLCDDNLSLSNKLSDCKFELEQLKEEKKSQERYWYLDSRFIYGVLMGMFLHIAWDRWF